MKKVCLLLLLLFVCTSSQAQKPSAAPSLSAADIIVASYTDSLYQLSEYYNTSWKYRGKDLLANPYYYRLFVQPTFYFNPIRQQMDLDWHPADSLRVPMRPLVDHDDKILEANTAMNHFFSDLYISHPQYIVANQSTLDKNEGLRTDLKHETEHKVELASHVTTPKPVQVYEPINVVGYRPNFWKFTQTYGLQLMQYYFSENWYQGGSNYNSALVTAKITANYNNQSKITFNNTLTVQLGFQTVKADTIHPWHSTTDQLRMINALSVKAAKNWSYTATLTSTTRMTPQYPNNSRLATADFFSQFESVLSLGMAWSLAKKNFNVNINMAPLSYDWKDVGRKRLRARYGIYPNHHSREYIGSSVTINYTWKLMNELSWASRLYYFTNYKKVQFDWENTFTFTINKYLNTKLYLYPRFDDTIFDDDGKHTIQFKQWLSLGLNITL